MTGVSGKLPIEIGSITELTVLSLEESDLSGGPIPESIVNCIKLEILNLYNCDIPGEIPVGLSALKLLGIQLNS
jgi:hypothetical protein